MKSVGKISGMNVFTVFFHVSFFCCFFLYLWLYGNTLLIYHAFGRFLDYPLFFTGWRFLGETIDHPGGIVDYISAFLSQFYYYPLGGAAVITIVISLTCLAFATLISFAGFHYLAVIFGYAPAIFFLAMHSRCEHHLAFFITLLINLWTLIIYEKIRLKGLAVRCCLFSVMFVLLYLVVGAGAFVFGILAVGFEIFIRRNFSTAVLNFLSAGLLPLAFGWYFNIGPVDIYMYSLPMNTILSLDDKTASMALYISVLCFLVTLSGLKFFFSRKTSENTSRKQAGKKSKKDKTPKIRFARFAGPIVVITAAFVAVSLSSSDMKKQKQRLQANFYADNGMWTEFLEYANRFPAVTRDPEGNHNIIMALHHTGRLGEELFRYPQFKEGMFLPPLQPGVRRFRRGMSYIRLSLLLGRVNIAEKEAYEVLENSGEYPELLWNLAIINVAKGQPETAKVFLEVLSRDLIHGKKAKDTLQKLAEDPELSNDKEISRLRSVMLVKDVTVDQPLEEVMSDLLEVNPNNKLAFEYLMLYYLKAKKVDKIAGNMYRFGDFGYKKIPRHFEEAILIHLGKGHKRLKSYGWKINPQTYKTGDRFMAAIRLNPPGRMSSARNLASDFGSTYFYYYVFSQTGSGL